MTLALTILARLLGCRIVGHSWVYRASFDDGRWTEFRACAIAACQRVEIRAEGAWRALDRGGKPWEAV